MPKTGAAKPRKGSSRRAAKNGSAKKNGSARNGSAKKNGNGAAHRLDLNAEELEVLLKACRKYNATLPCYLASARDDVVRSQSLIKRLGGMIDTAN